MSQPGFVGGLPRIGTGIAATHRNVFLGGDWECYLPGGKQIESDSTRDTLNTGDLTVIRAGMLMGEITASGLYANSIMGLTNAALAVGATSLTVTAAAAVELARRVGASGTFKLIGPPAANGVVAEETITYSAISGTTVTITASTNAFISGSFICPTDGSEYPKTIIPDGYGINLLDDEGTARDQPFPKMPIGGMILSSNVLFWPSDTSLRAWIVGAMSGQGKGKFTFDHLY